VQYALVAGGSKGIGYSIALALAKRKYNLVLIGRHADALIAAKNIFELLYKVHVKIFELDLSLPGSTEVIATWCAKEKLPLKLLCNVAGLGGKMDFLSLPLNKLRTMVSLNVSSQMALSLGLLPLLEKNAPSNILNVASMAGFAPIPEKNMYSATKAAVIFFSYALHYQLKKRMISVSCLCPGPVFTKPEIKEDTIAKLGWFGKLMAVTPTKVGEAAVRDTLVGKMIIIPGVLAKTMAVILRLLPRRAITSIYFAMGQK
jgi:short-subunit dehydrogenase